jgi:hypothetical protein
MKYLIALAALAPLSAFANPCVSNTTGTCKYTGDNSPTVQQGQQQAAVAGSKSDASASAVGATTVDVVGDNIRYPRIPVNTAVAGFQMTTAPCRYAEGLGIQTTPAGASVGFTFKDKECWKVGLAQQFYAVQQWEAGDRLMCSVKDVAAVLGKECLMILTAGHARPVAVAPPAAKLYTQQEVDAMRIKLVSK